jgi:hypothetical protein
MLKILSVKLKTAKTIGYYTHTPSHLHNAHTCTCTNTKTEDKWNTKANPGMKPVNYFPHYSEINQV